jgi:hypothetical protein
LINPITGSWDEELVRQIFVPQDINLILATPVHVDLEDLVAWHYDKREMFSVKSVYKVHGCHIQRSNGGGGGSSGEGGELEKAQWKQIWGLKCPGKV